VGVTVIAIGRVFASAEVAAHWHATRAFERASGARTSRIDGPRRILWVYVGDGFMRAARTAREGQSLGKPAIGMGSE
jgi:hypothetical protein